MRSGVRCNHQGRWCEKGVKDVAEILLRPPFLSLPPTRKHSSLTLPSSMKLFHLTGRCYEGCYKVTRQCTQRNLLVSCLLMFHHRLRFNCDVCLTYPHCTRPQIEKLWGVGGKQMRGLIYLKSCFFPFFFFPPPPPHHLHCDLNTILVTPVTESLKST